MHLRSKIIFDSMTVFDK